MLKKVVRKVFPPQTKTGKFLKNTASQVGLAKPVFYDEYYKNWVDHIEAETFLPVVNDKYDVTAPLFSIVIPFFNTKDKYLLPLIESVVNQSYGNWELIIGDGSNDAERAAAIQQIAAQDKRMKYHHFTRDTDISGNTNQALAHAHGKYIVFCDHDDTLSVHALNEVARVILKNPKVDIIYSDEDKISDDGKWRHSPFFKPIWSPHLFLQSNYTNHLSVVRQSLVEEAGGLRKEKNGAQDYDLLLRIHALGKNLTVEHIDKVLYHWREADNSTAADFSKKSYAFEAGRSSLQQHLEDRNLRGKVEVMEGRPGFYRTVLEPQKITNVKIYVGISDDDDENHTVIEKLKLHTNTSLKVEYVAVSQSDMDELEHQEKSNSLAIFEFRAVAYPKQTDWLDRLVGALELDDIKAIAPRIVTPDERCILDMGVVYSGNDEPIWLNHNMLTNDMTPNGHVEWIRDVDELTGNIIGFRADKQNDKGLYNVVWSHVDFKAYPIFGRSSFFNSNLELDQEGRIIVHECSRRT